MSDTERVVALALAQVGVHADPGTNRTKYGVWAEERGGPPNGEAWCAEFVSWCWHEGTDGATTICAGMPVGKGEVFDGGCSWIPTVIQWAEANDRWQDSDGDPLPGDLIVFQLATKHIGMVVGVEKDGLRLVCVEGNYSHGVHKTHYDVGDERILGFVRVG